MACQVCGGEFLASELVRRWDNLWVCRSDFELRHPQEGVVARRDQISPPYSSPEPEDYFLDPNEVTRDYLHPGRKPTYFIWKDTEYQVWLDDDNFNWVDT